VDQRLQGKRAIVTGGGSGIGRGTAIKFAEEGASVGILDINLQSAEQVAEEIEKAQKMRAELGYFKGGNAVLPRLSEDEYPGSQRAVDVPKLADELSSLTVSESVELAAMLKTKWNIS